MIEIEKIGPHVLSATLSGQIEAQDIAAFDQAIRAEFSGDGRLHLLVDLTGITDVTLGAMAEDLRAETALLPHLRRFGRMAAITEKAWVATLMRAAGHLMPSLEFRSFGPGQGDEARAFVLGGASGADPVPAIRFLDPPHPHVIAYEIDGVIHQDDADAVIARLNALMAETEGQGRKIGLLVRFTHFGGFAPMMLLSGQLWTAKLAAIRNLHRYAIVGGGGWMEGVARLADPLTAVEMKCFPASEEAAARAWVVDGL
ncbi:MAG: STAS/SEC14 domain-containing protein [Rhodobacteraceae bacterium]|nr:STAS/SEC14 domain-containing protein [Paracoccaceae bacterium]